MLLDSNVIIYALQSDQTALRQFIQDNEPAVSLVSYAEVLGYHCLSVQERQFLEEFFEASNSLPITDDVAKDAVRLRQQRRISLGDALIAGTVLTYNLTLITHNVEDFDWIPDISIIDPIVD